jgi:hypothetical protein
MRRIAVFAVAALAAVCVAGGASAALKLVRVAGGFNSPVYATGAPGTRALFVVSQNGRVIRIRTGHRNTFLNIADRVSSPSDGGGGEEGLLSIAFHPNYAQNRRFFVYFTNNQGDLRIIGFRANDAGTRARERTSRRWAAIRHPTHTNHNGGQLQFGNDGMLYAATGDGGSGGDLARNRHSRLGKLLRINVGDRDSRPQIVAVGFRNPWRFSVDRATGRFFLGDVGQNTWEEIDTWRPGAQGLENFGWNRFEGDHLYSSSNPLGPGRYVPPIHEYSQSSGRCSVTGGFMVRGNVPGAGRYFYGDYCTGDVWSFRYESGQATGNRGEPFTVSSLSSFGLNHRGVLLVVSRSGTVYRVANG